MLVNKMQHMFRHVVQSSFQCREMSVMRKSLKYSLFGEPGEVLEIVEEKIPDPKDNEVLVKVLASPINPADINTIQGKYPVKPKFPAIGGNEFVGVVERVGKDVKNLTVGQRVVPAINALGTWTTHAAFTEDQLFSVSDKIGLAEAATLTVNPCTAYRMLKDFVSLKPGDCVIQNGANSAVGQAVHQLCRIWQLQSVGVVRNRPEVAHLKSHLRSLGATEVFTEEEICASTVFKKGILPKPKLALNCVGGHSATEITRHLAPGGVMVTYGGMSREPVNVATASLIFNDISFRGFWMTRWTQHNAQSGERERMFKELCDWIEAGQFVAAKHKMVTMSKYKEAVTAARNFKGFTGKKYLLDMTTED